MTTGISPATAQANWKRVSNWANARPRLACGASRWTMLSNASRPTAAAKLTTTASPTPAATPPSSAADDAGDRRQRQRAGEHHLLAGRAGAAAARSRCRPSRRAPTGRRPRRTTPCPAVCVRSQNARRKNTNPTLARSTTIATAASCRPGRVQLHPLGRLLGRGGDDVGRQPGGARQGDGEQRRRSRSASPQPSTGVSWSSAAGMTATNPVSPAITPSFELASTSSASVRTTDGTSACFDTRYVFCSTSAAKTSGNSASCRSRPPSARPARPGPRRRAGSPCAGRRRRGR